MHVCVRLCVCLYKYFWAPTHPTTCLSTKIVRKVFVGSGVSGSGV